MLYAIDFAFSKQVLCQTIDFLFCMEIIVVDKHT